jgi:cold shock CspA family protein
MSRPSDDDDAPIDEEAYDLGPVKKPDAALFSATSYMTSNTAAATSSSEPAPSWATAWKEQKAKPPRLRGTCATWNNDRGWGFIAREDGEADLYVHQRDVVKKGFRSLLVGESVEFAVGAMADGKLHAVRVTGPGGAECVGRSKTLVPDGESDEDIAAHVPGKDAADADGASADVRVSGGKIRAAKEGASGRCKKPYAFVPRAVSRPRPMPKSVPKVRASTPSPI